jgi:hypothetical protein
MAKAKTGTKTAKGAPAGNGGAAAKKTSKTKGSAPGTGNGAPPQGTAQAAGTGGVPATAADAAAAAALPKATVDRGIPPSIDQVQTLASPPVQSALTSNAAVLTALGVDGNKLAADATATAEAGERTLRLFESAFRSMQDYHVRAKALAPEVTELSAAVRKLDPTSPLGAAFAPFVQERAAARGTAAAKRTKQKKARVKAKASASPAPAATPKS